MWLLKFLQISLRFDGDAVKRLVGGGGVLINFHETKKKRKNKTKQIGSSIPVG